MAAHVPSASRKSESDACPVGTSNKRNEWQCRLIKNSILAVAVIAACGASPASADIRTGKLVCNVAAGAGFVVGSEKALTCRYDSVDGRHEYYVGAINKYGVDIGTTSGGTLIWAVFEPALRNGGLTGVYSGGTAEFTLGVGIGASALVGGGDGGVTLQPVSINAQSGPELRRRRRGHDPDPDRPAAPVEPVQRSAHSPRAARVIGTGPHSRSCLRTLQYEPADTCVWRVFIWPQEADRTIHYGPHDLAVDQRRATYGA